VNGTPPQATTHGYDLNGSEISKVTTGADSITYSWDLSNRLSGATINRMQNGQSIVIATAYQYNSDGIRTRSDSTTTTNDVVTDQQSNLFVIDNNNPTGYAQILEEINAQGLLLAMTQYGMEPISQFRNGAESFYHMDGHSGVRLLTAGTGIVVSSVIYDAYGQLLRSVGNIANLLLYRGERFDPILGNYYLRARFYNPVTGRFTRIDPLIGQVRLPLTLNKYLYGNSDPVNHADPSGKLAVLYVLIAIVAALLLYALLSKANTYWRAYNRWIIIGESVRIRLQQLLQSRAPRTPAGQIEAQRIADAIYYTLRNNKRVNADGVPFWNDERCNGYWCYEWAWAYQKAFDHERQASFSAVVEAAKTSKGLGHYWLKITPTNGSSPIYVDDSFFDGTFVHEKRPEPPGYKYDPTAKLDRGVPPPAYDGDGNIIIE
jgi:RHS repeat-associated protein